jgi:hypothetical protein
MTSARGGSHSPGAGGQQAGRPPDRPLASANDGQVNPSSADDAVVRRTKDGWRVGSSDLPDLTSAMVLADLLAAELAAPGAGGEGDTGTQGDAGQPKDASETNRLRATIDQLEHALMARVRVEQAIGVLAERHRIQPRQAFEQLRQAARSRGRRVIDIASDVVASATNPLLQLPDELSRPRSPGRQTRQPRGVLGSE